MSEYRVTDCGVADEWMVVDDTTGKEVAGPFDTREEADSYSPWEDLMVVRADTVLEPDTLAGQDLADLRARLSLFRHYAAEFAARLGAGNPRDVYGPLGDIETLGEAALTALERLQQEVRRG